MTDMNDPVYVELTKARVKLLLSRPFIGNLATRLTLVDATSWCKTAATDGRHFFYNREFIKSLTLPQLLFLVGHEVLHCVFDHLGRRGNRDPKLWNMACLAWGTPILMADGSVQPIQRVLPGDWVASPFGSSQVLGNMFSGIKHTMEFVVGDASIRSTCDHKYASNNGSFQHAEKIARACGHGYLLNETGIARVCSRELRHHVAAGVVGSDRGRVLEYRRISEQERADGEQVFAEAVQLAALSVAAAFGGGVFGRDHGWRGHHHGADPREVREANDRRLEYLRAVAGLAGGPRLLLHRAEESSRTALLFPDYIGLGDRAGAAAVAALSRGQAAARADLAAHYGNPESAAVSWAAAGGSHGTALGTAGVECARFSVREGSGELYPVFDLVTEAGSFFASGILTHNCDYIINYVLDHEKIGEMPPQGLFDRKYTDEMTAEEVYELLKKNSVTIKMPLDEHLEMAGEDGEGDGGDQQGQSVSVTVTGKDGPPKLTEEDLQRIRNEIKSAVIQTAQQVGAGNVPAGIRRMIDSLIQPKLDWRSLLDAHVRSSVKDDYTFQRIARRTWSTGALMPAQNNMETVEVAVAIDASGSMTEEMLRDLLSETMGIMQTFPDFRVHLWTFDTEVYDYVVFTPENVHDVANYPLRGGGGTAFECCYEFMRREGIEPPRFVMFTDGYPNSTWGDPSYCDTLFIIHGNTSIVAPFGLTAYYDEPDKKARKG